MNVWLTRVFCIPQFPHLQTKNSMLQHCTRRTFPAFMAIRTSRSYSVKKESREDLIAKQDLLSYTAIHNLNQKYNLFNETVTRVVDLGFAPGNWLQFARNELLLIFNIDPLKINTKCILVGVDLLFCQAPAGTYAIQGNIFSQNTHSNILDILKKRMYILAKAQKNFAETPLTAAPNIEDDISRLVQKVSTLTLDSELAYFKEDIGLSEYQADLVLSDLSVPYLQRNGYFSNTMSKPYMRMREDEILRQPFSNPHTAHIDLADCAVLLCCETLAKDGTLLLRLAEVKIKDPELLLLESRLQKMFGSVERWYMKHSDPSHSLRELFFICKHKKSETVSKYDLFDVERISLKAFANSDET